MSLQLGPGPVRGPRADCYTDAHLTRQSEDRRVGCACWLLAHCSVVKEPRAPTTDVRRADETTAIQSRMPSWPRYKVNPRRRERGAVPVFKWVAGDVFPSRESNSNDTPELVKSIRRAGQSAVCPPGAPGRRDHPWRPPGPPGPTRRASPLLGPTISGLPSPTARGRP